MGSEECLCTPPFQNRFHQFHGIYAALSYKQAMVSNWDDWRDRIPVDDCIPWMTEVTGDPQRERTPVNSGKPGSSGACNTCGTWMPYATVVAARTQTPNLPPAIHALLAVMTETAKHRNSSFPLLDISYNTEITKKVWYLLSLLWSSKNPTIELPKGVCCGLPAKISLKIIEIITERFVNCSAKGSPLWLQQ